MLGFFACSDEGRLRMILGWDWIEVQISIFNFILQLAENIFNFYFSCLTSKWSMIWIISHSNYLKKSNLRWDGKQNDQRDCFFFFF